MPKIEAQAFTANWNKTVNWARKNNIPFSAYYPVYQMDVQRMMTGYQMSEEERIKAIEAAYGLNYSNALPTDRPSWTDFKGNAVRNAQDIFVGMAPQNLISNAVDTLKNTIMHPSSVFGAIGDLITGNTGAAGQQVLSQHDIWQWVPGAYDLATVFAADPHLTGSKGVEALAKQPITALVDVIPFGRVLSEGVLRGSTKAAASATAKTGLDIAELRKMGMWRVGSRWIKGTEMPNLFMKEQHPWAITQIDPETKNLTIVGWKDRLTIGERWDMVKNKLNMGSEQADIYERRLIANQEGTELVRRIAMPALKVMSELSAQEREAFTKWTQEDFRTLEEKMADATVPIKLRNAYEAAHMWARKLNEMHMQAGRAIPIRQPLLDENGNEVWVEETYMLGTSKYGAVTRAADVAREAQIRLDKAAEPLDAILIKIDENERNYFGLFQLLNDQRQSVFQSIKASIPHLTSQTATERMQATLPDGAKWEDAVTAQTPLIHNLLGLLPSDRVTIHQVNALRDMFADGGLIDQMYKAYSEQDWVKLNQVSRMVIRKFRGKSFEKIPQQGRATLAIIRRNAEVLQKFAAERQKLVEEADKLEFGIYRGSRLKKKGAGYQGSIIYLSEQATKAHQAWIKAAIHNPPDVWKNTAMEGIATRLAQEQRTAANMDKSGDVLRKQGWAETNVTKVLRDPMTMQELMTNEAKNSLGNAMLPDIDIVEEARVREDMYNELSSLRARGEQPLYVPAQTAADIARGTPGYDVYVRGVRARKPGSTYEKTWGYTPTIYDVASGLLKATKEIVEQDMTQRFVEQELMPRLLDAGDTQKMIRNYFQDEIGQIAQDVAEGKPRTMGALTEIDYGLDRWNLKGFNPADIFGEGFSHPALDRPYYINADLARAFQKTITEYQYPGESFYDRGTQLFRFSILGLSPRYTAHILFGGTFMMLLRTNPWDLRKYMGDAWYYARHGSFSEKTLQRFPDAHLLQAEQSTEEGLAAAQFHHAAMNSAGRNWLIPEWLDRKLLSDTYTNRIKAAADLNFRFTRAIRKFQNSIVYLDGAAKAMEDGKMYYHTEEIERTPVKEGATIDGQGRPIYHPVTGKRLTDQVRSKIPMTPQQAHLEGMHAVAEVMGNLRHMTPLERSILTKIFPFYGWTKHVLKYVLSYPFDHPYRAVIISMMAMQNAEDWASGLPLRLQLLTFLGHPDQFGNVTGIDTKSLDPFRDTANYASFVGLFESLNPAITGLGSIVDPQFSFAGQNLYPHVTFNSLYGVKTAGPGGNVWTAAEQYIPQLSALDAAFNFSGQMGYLKTSNPNLFWKKVTESLGLPLVPQHLNLRQIAAQGEIDRYTEAEHDALRAAQTGDMSALAGYDPNTPVPDPLNPYYTVTPAYIAALNQESEQKYHLPWYATGRPPPNPPL